MPRPQFSIRTLLWLTLVVAAFLGGMAVQRQVDEPNQSGGPRAFYVLGPGELVMLPNGTSRFQAMLESGGK